MSLTPMAYIGRIDYRYKSQSKGIYKMKTPAKGWSKGWRVRFVITENGKHKSVGYKCFNDNKYAGGKDESLVHAKIWRDSKYEELLILGTIKPYKESYGRPISSTPTTKRSYTRLRTNNTSGVSGVGKFKWSYVKKIGWGETRTIYSFAWRATWTEYYIRNGKPRRSSKVKSFTVREHGEQRAFDMACKIRAEKVQYLLSPHHMKIRQEYQKQYK